MGISLDDAVFDGSLGRQRCKFVTAFTTAVKLIKVKSSSKDDNDVTVWLEAYRVLYQLSVSPGRILSSSGIAFERALSSVRSEVIVCGISHGCYVVACILVMRRHIVYI